MADSIFTKIIKGEVPANKVYEDELTYAFLDHQPKTPGHILVVSKRQAEFVWDLSDEEYQALMATVRKVANQIKKVLNPKYVGEQIEGAAVPHAHVHVFPFSSIEEYDAKPSGPADPNDLAKMAAKLAF